MSDSGLATELGRRLKALRAKAGLTQSEVGKRLGVKPPFGQNYVSRLEAGKAGEPVLKTIVNYIVACGESAGAFFAEMAREGALTGKPEPGIHLGEPGRAGDSRGRRSAAERRRERQRTERGLVASLRAEVMPIAVKYAADLKGFRTVSFLQSAEFFYKAWKMAIARSAGKNPEPFIREEFAKVVETGVKDGLQREAMQLIADKVARRLRKMRGLSSGED